MFDRFKSIRLAAYRTCPVWLLAVVMCASGCRRTRSHQVEHDPPSDAQTAVIVETAEQTFVPTDYWTPAPPTNLNQQRPDDSQWHLSLDEAVAIALAQNKQLLVDLHLPHETCEDIVLQDSAFDTLFQAGGGWARAATQITNVVDGPGGNVASSATDTFGPPNGLSDQLRISKTTRTGGEVSAQFGSTYTLTEPSGAFLNLNPAIQSTLSFEVDHPLFQGAGRDFNEIKVRIAQQLHHISINRVNILVQKTVVDTATSYWSLYGAIAALNARDQVVHEAQRTWEREQAKLEIGESAKPQVAEARVQLERFRADRAVALKVVADAERELRRVLGQPLEDGRRIMPSTVPMKTAPVADWDSGVVAAMSNRPELATQKAAVEAAWLAMASARDGLRPDVRAYARYAITGASNKFDDTVATISDSEFTSWSMGFLYERPLSRRREHALHNQTHIALSRENKTLELIRQDIIVDLHEAFQAIQNAWNIIQLQSDRVEAATLVLESRRAMYEVGEISLDSYLRGLEIWSTSIAEQRAALTNYNQARARWEYARGSILEAMGVKLDGLDSQNEPDGFPVEQLVPPEPQRDQDRPPSKPATVPDNQPEATPPSDD